MITLDEITTITLSIVFIDDIDFRHCWAMMITIIDCRLRYFRHYWYWLFTLIISLAIGFHWDFADVITLTLFSSLILRWYADADADCLITFIATLMIDDTPCCFWWWLHFRRHYFRFDADVAWWLLILLFWYWCCCCYYYWFSFFRWCLSLMLSLRYAAFHWSLLMFVATCRHFFWCRWLFLRHDTSFLQPHTLRFRWWLRFSLYYITPRHCHWYYFDICFAMPAPLIIFIFAFAYAAFRFSFADAADAFFLRWCCIIDYFHAFFLSHAFFSPHFHCRLRRYAFALIDSRYWCFSLLLICHDISCWWHFAYAR